MEEPKRGSVFIFEFLKDKMQDYVKENMTVHFVIRKLKKTTLSSKSMQTNNTSALPSGIESSKEQ